MVEAVTFGQQAVVGVVEMAKIRTMLVLPLAMAVLLMLLPKKSKNQS